MPLPKYKNLVPVVLCPQTVAEFNVNMSSITGSGTSLEKQGNSGH